MTFGSATIKNDEGQVFRTVLTKDTEDRFVWTGPEVHDRHLKASTSVWWAAKMLLEEFEGAILHMNLG